MHQGDEQMYRLEFVIQGGKHDDQPSTLGVGDSIFRRQHLSLNCICIVYANIIQKI